MASSSSSSSSAPCFVPCGSSPLFGIPFHRPSIRAFSLPPIHASSVPDPPSYSSSHSLLKQRMHISPKHFAHEDSWFRICGSAVDYAAMALAGEVICHFSGIDNFGGFHLCSDVLLQGLGFAVFPLLALSLILDDQMVLKSSTARAIRESEDEQTSNLFAGMYPWQIMLIVTMDVIAEEILFRVAIQGGLVHAFLSHDFTSSNVGVAALAGDFPFLAPFAHAVAAVFTSALIGSILFVCQGPSYIASDGFLSTKELKETIADWKEQQQLKTVYSSLLDSMLALYLGFEWAQTHNILAPIITHAIYSSFIVINSLRRHKGILRQKTESMMLHDASDL